MCLFSPAPIQREKGSFSCEKHTASDPFLFRPLAAKLLIKLLRRQSFPALKPSAGKYVPAVLGLHALTKTVNLLALPFLGLIRLKHVGAPLFQLF